MAQPIAKDGELILFFCSFFFLLLVRIRMKNGFESSLFRTEKLQCVFLSGLIYSFMVYFVEGTKLTQLPELNLCSEFQNIEWDELIGESKTFTVKLPEHLISPVYVRQGFTDVGFSLIRLVFLK